MHVDWLIAGLGNPGSRYEKTRHNIGWMVCEEILKRQKAELVPGKGQYYSANLRIRGKSVLLMLPTTYMNDSGTAISKVAAQLQLKSDQIMIIVDEFNFPTGKVHLRLGGSDGGHNGTQSVIQELRSEKFWRMRCGIDKNFGMGELVEYVLSEFSATERDSRDRMIQRAADATELIMKAGVSRAASDINSDKEPLL